MFRLLKAAVIAVLSASSLLNASGELSLPYSDFPKKADAKKVREVVDHYTLTHSTPEKPFNTTSRTFNFLLDHMPLTTAIMRELDLEKYVITVREDGTMMSDDNDGVVGTFEPVFCTKSRRVLYGDGTFSAGLLGDIRGESVVVIDYVEDGPAVKCATAVYVKVHGFFAPFVRLASPIIRGMVSRKSASILTASMALSEKLTTDPDSVYEKIRKSDQITPEDMVEFRKEFVTREATSL